MIYNRICLIFLPPSKMIGALELSEKARLLELAGKEGRIDYIKTSHDEVMELLEIVTSELEDYLSTTQPSKEEEKDEIIDQEVAKAIEKAKNLK